MTRQKKARDIDGILLLDKPKAATSNAVLQRVKHLFNANKAGHTGALDPLATGMLPICFGEATKFSHYLLEADKRYHVIAKLGVRTNTSDSDGEIIRTLPVQVSLSDLIQKLDLFRGKQKQIPTMFSALKYQGKPLYEYARQGISIPRTGRDIQVYQLKLIRFHNDEVELEIHCSKGTYIRTIIDDLGEQLGCGAHVIFLRRLQVAHFFPDKMITLDVLSAYKSNEAELTALLLPIDTAVEMLPKILLSMEQGKQILTGKSIELPPATADGLVRLYLDDGDNKHFIGIGSCQGNHLLPKRLIAT